MSKYWNYKKKPEQITTLPALRNSPEPYHKVTHRAIGDIPGCTPAPREHTFRDTSAEEAAGMTTMRAALYAAEIQKYVNGEYGGNHGLKEMWNAIERIKPLFGPHGEKL
jgi:hypothetical protein